MNGSVSVEIAMDGQNFIPTDITFTYELEGEAGKAGAKGGKKKK